MHAPNAMGVSKNSMRTTEASGAGRFALKTASRGNKLVTCEPSGGGRGYGGKGGLTYEHREVHQVWSLSLPFHTATRPVLATISSRSSYPQAKSGGTPRVPQRACG